MYPIGTPGLSVESLAQLARPPLHIHGCNINTNKCLSTYHVMLHIMSYYYKIRPFIIFFWGGDVGFVWVTCFIEGPVNIFLQLLLKLFSHKKEDVREI